MYTKRFVHNHDCGFKNVVVDVRPKVELGAAFLVRPICIELDVELELVKEESK